MDPQDIKITAEPLDFESCRFAVSQPVYPGRSFYFGSPEKAPGSPLIEELFAIEGVRSVLVQDNIVTVTTMGVEDWRPIAKQIGGAIRNVLTSGRPAISDEIARNLPSEEVIRWKVETLLANEINPAIASHGGMCELIDVKGNEVFLRLGGGCQGCGAAKMTLKLGIERAIREAVPEVGAILDTTDHAAGRNPYYAPAP
ncbi:MAG: NifU family protein [Candidatus Eisenbacteria bacterium]|nr:NifU family protein [Candidatus Eisenbacteria bacterium]